MQTSHLRSQPLRLGALAICGLLRRGLPLEHLGELSMPGLALTNPAAKHHGCRLVSGVLEVPKVQAEVSRLIHAQWILDRSNVLIQSPYSKRDSYNMLQHATTTGTKDWQTY